MIKTLKYWRYRKYKTKRKTMCDNCAFRPYSRERRDILGWKELFASLVKGDVFVCHKTMYNLTPFKEKYAKYDSHRKTDGTSCNAEDHHICAGYLALFSDRHEEADFVIEEKQTQESI